MYERLLYTKICTEPHPYCCEAVILLINQYVTRVPKFYLFITLWSWLHFYDTHLCNFVASNKLRAVFPVACCRTIDVTTFKVYIYPLRILHSWIIYHILGCYVRAFRFSFSPLLHGIDTHICRCIIICTCLLFSLQ